MWGVSGSLPQPMDTRPSTLLHVPTALVAFTTALFPASGLATESVDLDAIGQVARVVKWGGVFTSLLVIAGVWVAIRFLRDSVASLSDRFPSRRLLLQKTATFAQFLLYVGTGVIVVALSFELNDSVVALIGGTIAVSIGFAIKDLVAPFIAGIVVTR